MKVIDLDPNMQAIGRLAYFAFGSAFNVLAKKLDAFIPGEDDRRTFGERTMAELMSGKYHMSLKMYAYFVLH